MAFDPYHKWLGIAPEEQPPHAYRLLGIKVFENDPDVIENAADQRLSHLRTFQTGKHSDDSQRLLNEVATAKRRLLQADEKEVYDEALRRALGNQAGDSATSRGRPAGQQRAVPRPKPRPASSLARGGPASPLVATPLPGDSGVLDAEPVEMPASSGSSVIPIRGGRSPRRRPPPTPFYKQPIALVLGAVGLLFAAGLVAAVITTGNGRDGASQAERTDEAINDDSPTTADKPAHNLPPRASTPPVGAADSSGESAAPPRTTSTNEPGGSDPASADEGAPEGVAQAAGSAEPATLARPVDLLSQTSPKGRPVRGKWFRVKSNQGRQVEMWTDPQKGGLYHLSCNASDNYDLICTVERLDAAPAPFGLIVSVGRGKAGLMFDHPAGTEWISGIDLVGPELGGSNRTRHNGRVLPKGKSVQLVVQVRSDSLAVRAEGRELLRYAGERSKLSVPAVWNVPPAPGVFLWSGQGRFRVGPITLSSPASTVGPVVAQNDPAKRARLPHQPTGAADHRNIDGGSLSVKSRIPESPSPARLPVPAPEEQRRLGKQLAEIYRIDEVRDPKQRLAVARELLRLARESHGKPTERFVMYSAAVKLAQAVGHLDMAFDLVEEVGRYYEINTLQAKSDVYQDLAKRAIEPTAVKKLVTKSAELTRQALEADDYITALAVARAAYTATAKDAGQKWRTAAYKQREYVDRLYTRWNRYKMALKRLETEPDHAISRQFVARWHAERGEYAAALQHAAKGADPKLGPLAARDIAAAEEQDATKQIALGDAWWQAAESLADNADQQLALSRAGHWYQRARPHVTSTINELKIDKRLDMIRRAVRPAR